MDYEAHVVASNDFEDIESQLNAFFKRVRPLVVLPPAFVADGLEWTYSALIIYVPRVRAGQGKAGREKQG